MTDDRTSTGLFLSDRQIIKKLGVSFPVGYRALRMLDQRRGGVPFPQKQAIFGGRRYWPAVVRWLNLFCGAERAEPGQMPQTSIENWDALNVKRRGTNPRRNSEITQLRPANGPIHMASEKTKS